MNQDDVLKINFHVILIYGDSATHTTDPSSNMYSILASLDFYIIEALPAKLSPYYPALSS